MSKKKPSKKPVPVPPPVPAAPEAAVDKFSELSVALDGLNLRVWHLEQQVAALRKPWSIWSLLRG
jgi:hypothetical protein